MKNKTLTAEAGRYIPACIWLERMNLEPMITVIGTIEIINKIKENNAKMSKKHHIIDMWYGDKFESKKYKACASFYPHGSLGGYCYAGNIFDENGEIIGDYATSDSIWIEDIFIINFGD